MRAASLWRSRRTIGSAPLLIFARLSSSAEYMPSHFSLPSHMPLSRQSISQSAGLAGSLARWFASVFGVVDAAHLVAG